MLIAWMTTGSLGMMVARYLKEMAKGQNLWGKDIWFLVRLHRYNNILQRNYHNMTIINEQLGNYLKLADNYC